KLALDPRVISLREFFERVRRFVFCRAPRRALFRYRIKSALDQVARILRFPTRFFERHIAVDAERIETLATGVTELQAPVFAAARRNVQKQSVAVEVLSGTSATTLNIRQFFVCHDVPVRGPIYPKIYP